MAASFLDPDERGGISNITSILEGKVAKLLMQVNSDNRKEINKIICAGYTKAAILDFRRKLFSMGQKFEAEKNVGGATEKDAATFDADDSTRSVTSQNTERGLVNRKVKPAIADDCIDLAVYVKNPKGPFPQHVQSSQDSEKKSPCKQKLPSDKSLSNGISSLGEGRSECDKEVDPVGVQKRFERFVIEESYSAEKDTKGREIPVSVTKLCESGTSTKGLVKLVTIGTQTEETRIRSEQFAERREKDESVSENQSIDTDMSRKRTARERDGRGEGNEVSDLEMTVERLLQKCDSAEKRIVILEHNHEKELSVVKAEHSIIKEELKEVKEKLSVRKGIKTMNRSAPSTSTRSKTRECEKTREMEIDLTESAEGWDPSTSTTMVWTQDSQGDAILTRATPVHTENPRNRDNRKQNRYVSSGSDTQHISKDRAPSVMKENFERNGEKLPPINEGASCNRCENIVNTMKRGDAASSMQRQHNDDESCDSTPTSEDERNIAKRIRMEKESRTSKMDNKRKDGKKDLVSENVNDLSDDSTEHESFSSIVAKTASKAMDEDGEWLSPKKSGKKALPRIAGEVESDIKEFLVRGLSVKNFKVHRDLENAVKNHCDEQKLVTFNRRVITFKGNRKTVGCKITIKEEDTDRIYSRGFWPKGVSVREWFEGKPTDRDRYFESSDNSEDNRS